MVQLLRWTQRNGTVVEVDSMGLKGAIERLLRRRNAEGRQWTKDPGEGGEEEMTMMMMTMTMTMTMNTMMTRRRRRRMTTRRDRKGKWESTTGRF